MGEERETARFAQVLELGVGNLDQLVLTGESLAKIGVPDRYIFPEESDALADRADLIFAAA